MSNTISEIVISVFILGLVFMFINLYKGDMEIIYQASNKTYDNQKVVEQSVVGTLGQDAVKGCDVVSAIRYYYIYKKTGPVTIKVTTNGGGGQSHTYTGENYNAAVFEVPFESDFSANYEYAGKYISKITYVEQE